MEVMLPHLSDQIKVHQNVIIKLFCALNDLMSILNQ